jgi:hypothetical protein
VREVVREQVVVDRPAAEARKHLAKLQEWPSWAAHIRRMDPTPPGELTASTQVLLHMRAGPSTNLIVTEYDPPRRWVWEGRSFGVTTRFEHALEEIGEARTRIWFLAWMSGPLAGPGGWVFGKMMHRYLCRALPKLKREMEATN